MTRLVGRAAELEEIRRLLAGSRLLTLTGAGGSGKTRLAAELARRVGPELPGGAVWIELAGVADPALVPLQVLTGLGLQDQPRERLPTAAILAALGCRPALLVLDNCEQVVDACAVLAEELLGGCPDLKILSTSREALGIAAEQVWLVPALSLPPDGRALTAVEALRSEAVQLFVERARAVAPSFALTDAAAAAVGHVCNRLDGLPLAIELAAARVKVLSPEEISERLDDAFGLLTTGGRTALPRHRTLQAAIDWSHDLLCPEERALLRRLAVFCGGFTLEAAAAVGAGDPVAAERVLDLLAALVDKSLAVRIEARPATRYRLLETVRRYARVRLDEAGETGDRTAAHARWCLALAERTEPHVIGGGRGTVWMERLAAEESNLRAAQDWFAAEGHAGEAQRLAAALPWLWFTRGQFGEARRRLEAVLAVGGEVAPHVRAGTLAALGTVRFWQGETEGVREPLEEALIDLRPDVDHHWLTMALVTLGTVHNMTGERQSASWLLQKALAVASAPGHDMLKAIALYHLGLASQSWGEIDAARASLRQSAAIGRATGIKCAIAHPSALLGQLEAAQGNFDEALEHLSASLSLLYELYDRWSLVQVLEGLAGIAAERGAHEEATRLLGACQRLRREMGAQAPWAQRDAVDATAARLRAALGEEAFAAWTLEGVKMPLDEVVEAALAWRETAGAGAAERGAAPGRPAVSGIGTGPLPALAVRSLGTLEVTLGSERLGDDRWGSARARELLLLLLVTGGRARDEIAETLWPGSAAERSRNALHQTVRRLRRALGDPRWVVTEGEIYRLAPGAPVEHDAGRFEAAARAALDARRAGGDALDALRAALDLYRGGFLAGLEVGEWAFEVRDRLERLHREALAACAEILIGRKAFAEAAEQLERLLAGDGLDEAAHRALMLCQAHLGRRSQALQTYRRLAERLDEELGVEPEPATLELLESIQTGARL